MASNATIDVPSKGGFSFDLCRRNEMLLKKGLRSPSFLKTGTTIVGLIFQVHQKFPCLFIFFFKFWVLTAFVISLDTVELNPYTF